MRHLATLGVATVWLFVAVSAQETASVSPPEDAADTPPPSPPPPVPKPPVKAPSPPPAPTPAPAQEDTPVVTTAEEKRRLTSAESGLQLYLAAGRGDLDAVKTQLQAGAPVDFEHQSGWTPLGNAAMSHHSNYEAVVAHLLQQRADPDKQDPRGRTPLFFAVSDGASEGVIKELLKYAKNINPHDMHGVTALNVATRKGNAMAAKVLLAAGADPKKGDSFGGSAYDEAVDSKVNAIRTLFNLTAVQSTPKGAGEL